MQESESNGLVALIGLFVIFAPAVMTFVIYYFKNKKLSRQVTEQVAQAELLSSKLHDVVKHRDSLSQYQGILDVQQHISKLSSDAEVENKKNFKLAQEAAQTVADEANGMLVDAKQELSDARAEGRDITRKAKVRAEKLDSEAAQKLTYATSEAEKITQRAEDKAREIAGSAYDIKESAEKYKELEKAMRNLIKGYGDEYLIPNHSLLDELAEEFDHKESGQKLKAARDHTRNMVKNQLAADCDYKEANRRTMALKFVISAFNGAADTAIAKAKHDNYGKLEQEIKDGSTLVNEHGEAFKNARITNEYLNSRLEELRWAVSTNELKLKEREEQRKIKEAMREEERARREYEKALRDAEKEEKLLQKAMLEARKQLEQASDAQRAEYEAKLLELEGKLGEAEAKNQRALSMAQQTRRGHVYVISNIGSFGENVYKVGMTRRLEPLDRVKELSDASVPFDFDVHAMIFSEDAPSLEKELHREFEAHRVNKVNARKEFFSVSLGEVKDKVTELKPDDIHWTMRAEAVQYRESKSIANKAVESTQELAEA